MILSEDTDELREWELDQEPLFFLFLMISCLQTVSEWRDLKIRSGSLSLTDMQIKYQQGGWWTPCVCVSECVCFCCRKNCWVWTSSNYLLGVFLLKLSCIMYVGERSLCFTLSCICTFLYTNCISTGDSVWQRRRSFRIWVLKFLWRPDELWSGAGGCWLYPLMSLCFFTGWRPKVCPLWWVWVWGGKET